MARYAKKSIATLFAASIFAVGVASPASAQHVEQDGLVNVNVGDVTLTDTVDVAAAVAVTACDLVDVGAVAVGVLAQATAVDRSGRERTICQTDAGPVTISNN